AETAEDVVAKLKTELRAGPLPTVGVDINERHFGRLVIDPTAETELGLILQKCGFTLIAPKAATLPDLKISGEAFSAFGIQKGSLVSCKARVELKAVNNSGQIVVVDRQTSVAVDITEQTAAKTALQKATVELAQRIVPQLSK